MFPAPGLLLATFATLGLAEAGPVSQSPAISISHAPIGCAVVDRFVEIEATLTPPASIAQARVLFRGENNENWYFTPLTADKKSAGRFVGHIPKPLASLKAFEYYVTATDTAFGETRTPDRRVTVVQGAACANGLLGRSANGLAVRLVISALSGGTPLPAGFASTGLIAGAAAGATTAAGAGSGGTAGTGAAGAGAAGGISGTTLAIAGGVVAAAAGVAVATGAVGGGGGGQGTCCPTGVFSLRFNPILDPTVCGAPQQALKADGIGLVIPAGVKQPQGNFDTTQGPGALPNAFYRVTGFISPTSFNATIACNPSGSNATPISATGSDYNFTGSFTFGGRSVTWTVRAGSQ